MLINHKDQEPKIGFVMNSDEFRTLNTIAGIGASALMEDKELAPSDEHFRRIQSMIAARADGRFDYDHVPLTRRPPRVEFDRKSLSTLGNVVSRGAFIHTRIHEVPMSELSPDNNQALAVAHSIEVAQTALWLPENDLESNIALYNHMPESEALLSGNAQALPDEVARMRRVYHAYMS